MNRQPSIVSRSTIHRHPPQNLDTNLIKAKACTLFSCPFSAKWCFFFIFSETDRHLSHVYTKEVRPPPRKKKEKKPSRNHTHPPIHTTSFFDYFNERAPKERIRLLNCRGKRKWIKNTSHLVFHVLKKSKYFKQSRLGLIGWREGGGG